ncbi:hypothetical protein ASZ90_018114 [hydrocarbon metagenome]|uniref:Uncharacterized protein n=1 Tax=hydrocarbon metagenome TaxID=938273 RepID=A0A0W8E717_9ZZZZ
MSNIKGRIINKESLVNNSAYVKEQYEGLLVCSDEQGFYNIGIQLNENDVLIVDQVKETSVRERIQNWAAQVEDIQRKYGSSGESLENYERLT